MANLYRNIKIIDPDLYSVILRNPINIPSPTPSSTQFILSNTPTLSKSQTATQILPTLTPSNTRTNTRTPQKTPKITPSTTPSNTCTRTNTPTPTTTRTVTTTRTLSATPSNTRTNTPTPSHTPTPSTTITITPTHTSTTTKTQSATVTSSNTPTTTKTRSATPTPTPTNTRTNTPTTTKTLSATLTPSSTKTLSASPTPTTTKTISASLTPSPTNTLSASPIPIIGNRGYIGGGGMSDGSYIINALDFITELKINVSSILITPRKFLSGVSNQYKGYFGGGSIHNSNVFDSIESLNFYSEVTAQLSSVLSSPTYFQGSMNSSAKGYFGGGHPYSMIKIDLLIFSSETTEISTLLLSEKRYALTATNNLENGYFVAGMGIIGQSNAGINIAIIDKIIFASNTLQTLSNKLNEPRYWLASVSNNDSNAYFGGGYASGIKSPYASNKIFKLTFNTDTTLTITSVLSYPRYGLTGLSNNSTGYFCGGYDSQNDDIFDKIIFTTETVSTLNSALFSSHSAAGVAPSPNSII